ncbi:hypothetical protein KVR01_002438 [Diaporthe batatas]|uniref:uncharacterized protein n=1 Tax=Diaporthe batatas TaxID=748121 RepID=UPI001D04B9D9|nr:uncharacterized protein KVR01_002438 [Diaporthe batatas]KAG8166749.1 hypothetical protein KVR01_002438 [Diaporthe batatas]
MRAPGNKFLDSVLVEIPDPDCSAKLVELSMEEIVIYEYMERHVEAYLVRKSGRKPKPKLKPKPKPKPKSSRTRNKPDSEMKKNPDAAQLCYTSLYEAALRLRQLVSSPLLLEQIVKDGIWTAEQAREMKNEAHRRGCSETPFIDYFGKGDDAIHFQPKENFGASLIRNLDANTGMEIPLSSKMREILEQIQAWQLDAPGDKIVVFFQFIDTQRLMGRVLQDHNIDFLYFIGEMDYQQREAAKERFRTVPEIKMMSMKCGGEAINLTCANRVIILQAICRVARLGQPKKVHAVRLLADETVDRRMFDMQEAKVCQIKTALQRLQEGSYGLRALRRVLGYHFEQVSVILHIAPIPNCLAIHNEAQKQPL